MCHLHILKLLLKRRCASKLVLNLLLEVHALLVIDRALYGLRTSGAHWHDRFADTLHEMRFSPCKADPNIWLKDVNTHYEFLSVSVDNIMILSSKNIQEFFDDLTNEYS